MTKDIYLHSHQCKENVKMPGIANWRTGFFRLMSVTDRLLHGNVENVNEHLFNKVVHYFVQRRTHLEKALSPKES